RPAKGTGGKAAWGRHLTAPGAERCWGELPTGYADSWISLGGAYGPACPLSGSWTTDRAPVLHCALQHNQRNEIPAQGFQQTFVFPALRRGLTMRRIALLLITLLFVSAL